MRPYRLLPYSSEALASELSFDKTLTNIVKAKNHFVYLNDYLGSQELSAQFMLIEESYISKDFISDYAAYYATAFFQYKKECKRIHFFSESFTNKELETALLSKASKSHKIWESYLGFIVVKPIPVTMIGTTVLKQFPHSETVGDRNYWGVREYTVHFFGREIRLNSLAFQEQDSVLSACATTAIWAMLHKASTDYHTYLKTPAEITKEAGAVVSETGRLFPNKGLNIAQMCKAIESAGLQVEVRLPQGEETRLNNIYIKKLIHAYSGLGIPIIIVIDVPVGHDYGLHANTVSGFKQSPPSYNPPEDDTVWLSNNIEKIYAHDDQWGPFARISFEGEDQLITPWTKFHPDEAATYTAAVIVPVYPKVRISYDDVEPAVIVLDTVFSTAFEGEFQYDFVWDIKVMFSETYKRRITSSNLSRTTKMRLLTISMPKYIWVAGCSIGDIHVADIVFDATDVANNMFAIHAVYYYKRFSSFLNTFFEKNPEIKSEYSPLNGRYVDFLINSVTN